MQKSRHVRAFFALIALAVPLLVVAGPTLYAIIAWDRLFRVEGPAHRRRIARWQSFWGEAALTVISRLMGISVRFDLPAPPLPGGPYLIIANHLGGFDGFLITKALRMMRGIADFRAVGKKAVASWPIVGRAWRELGYAFVVRNRDPDDLRTVERSGALAYADGSNYVIFPEGTVYNPGKAQHGYARVLPPKSGGFQTLRKVMPGCPVLSMTIRWDRANHGLSLFEGGVPLGRRVEVSARFADVDERDVREWLRAEWRRKDAAIAADA